VSIEAAPAHESPEVGSTDDLEAYFHSGAKPRANWTVGVEYETPAVSAATGEALPYDGARPSIRDVLEQLASDGESAPVYEQGHIIALRAATSASITLEPGGQIEMSGKQCATIHEAQEELSSHLRRLSVAAQSLGVRFLGLGITPITPLGRAPWMPKRRYRIMRDIMTRTGQLGQRMMVQTATVQGNFDYGSEDDAKRKFRVSMALSPVLVALSANSAVCDGRLMGHKSFRAHIWTDTDRDRCGLLPFAFDTDAIFRAYAEYALDVPMYFVARDDRLLPCSGMTFRSFMQNGFDGYRATIADWSTHLTTLFPEARLKTYIEVRAADGQPEDRILAIPALLKGILYDDDCTDAVWDVLAKLSLAERMDGQASAAKLGLEGSIGRHDFLTIVREVIAIAVEGLRRQAQLSTEGSDETRYLDALLRDVASGTTPADQVIARWNSGGPKALLDHASYQPRR
jgi:glutamate--cysteine ligase